MPSNINPRSGPFPVYPSTSPPGSDVGMFTISLTGVDLKTAATTNIFTVPTSRSFIGISCVAQVTSVTSGGSGSLASPKLQESGAGRTMIAGSTSGAITPVANQTVYAFGNIPTATTSTSNCTAGNKVQLVIAASNSGSNAVAGTVDVTGYYSA